LTFLTYNLFEYTNAVGPSLPSPLAVTHASCSQQNGKLLGIIGVLASLLQGGYTRRATSKPDGPSKLARAGMSACTLALVLLTIVSMSSLVLNHTDECLNEQLPHVGKMNGLLSPASVILYTSAALLAFVSSTVVNSLNALASLECSPQSGIEKGKALGTFRSRGQLGRAMGPLVATGLYWVMGPSYAYGVGAVGAALMASKMARLGKSIKSKGSKEL
jgi:MFS family permease